jgi:hypothetical protein
MRNFRQSTCIAMAALFCAAPMAMAGDRTHDRTRDRDQLKDGSCQISQIKAEEWTGLAAIQKHDHTRDQDKLRDGSCTV